ncbi:1018_t:CDS:2 [Acaulospora colombiana]|uniref:1018_t:CDS:1 n=1 Tax=Acaulospora colombiana TaxID=27376 RepID=A0ACA9K856_9GLOM|nr:1018_t:CDS:2 [Acaulospora colombiana]
MAADKFLDVGEWVVDQGILVMRTSEYFERKGRVDTRPCENPEVCLKRMGAR